MYELYELITILSKQKNYWKISIFFYEIICSAIDFPNKSLTIIDMGVRCNL